MKLKRSPGKIRASWKGLLLALIPLGLAFAKSNLAAATEPQTTLALYSFGTAGFSENEEGQQILSLIGLPVADEPEIGESLPPIDLGFWNIAPTGFPPDVETQWANGILYLAWAVTEENHILEYSPSLSTPQWKPWPTIPEETENQYRTELPRNEPLKFFRLRQLGP